MWVFDKESEKVVQRDVTYVPGLYKIFDEIVVNAADNKQRDPTMDRINVTIDQEAGTISVWNNGNGIPVVMHSTEKMYVPELIFGHLLTGSNFDDGEKKTTGGRNGYGAKLANIFSDEFVVETADSSTGKKFKQVFQNNMGVRNEPKIGAHSGKDYTCITFKPDLAKFKMSRLDDDTVALLSKRVYDVAGCCNSYKGTRLQVYLNGKKLPVKSFQEYMGLYQGLEECVAWEKIGDRWEIGVGPSDGQFTQVSYVNCICTTKGGQHANYIADKVTAKLASIIKKKNKGEEVKGHFVKNHLAIYVNCLIENPAFDSQTKESLTTRPSAFGSEVVLSDKFFKAIEKSSVIDKVLSWAAFKQKEQLKRKGGAKKTKLTGITKLDDANFAGGAKGKDCTLILTEGDSAKSLAVSGLSIVGRDYYGVFPLKGKLLNVREANHGQIMKNEEIQNICKILGLRHGVEYSDTKELRYGHLLIMADQDHDGSHIKGLIINFIHHFWPSLLACPGFLQQFITPIVRVSKGKHSQSFFTIPEYKAWKESSPGAGKGWTTKYFKGLGTSSAKDAKEYFADLTTHRIAFEAVSDQNEQCDVIDMAFSKKRVQDRKDWLTAFEPGTFVDYSVSEMSYDSFVNRELILFSMADNERSIPSIMDGFKPSQRKVLFACFKRKLKQEIKVAQLAGYVSEHGAYHHGEMSLNGTIVGMAQDFVGANNINLLFPSGQFGTRLQGGKDAASPRYIFTRLEAITRAIFHIDDDPLLNYLEDDGQSIEPDFYSPVLPLVLVNGGDGIGTGYSTFIPNYNPRDVIAALRAMLQDGDERESQELTPWYRGFSGEIEANGNKKSDDSFTVRGCYREVDENTIEITELPVRVWTQTYKAFLETMLPAAPDSKDAGMVKDFRENHTDREVSFTVVFADGVLAAMQAEKGGVLKRMKLETTLSTSNIVLFNTAGTLQKYSGAKEIIDEYYGPRLALYGSRKDSLVAKCEGEWAKLSNQVRFILAVISRELVVSNRPKKALLEELKASGYASITVSGVAKKKEESEDEEGDDGGDDDEEEAGAAAAGGSAKGYDYLLSMKIWSLTLERVEELRGQLTIKEEQLAELQATRPEEMWLRDLEAVEEALDDMDELLAKDAADEEKTRRKAQGKAKGKKKAPVARKPKKAQDSDDEDESSEDDGMDESDEEFEAAPKKKKASAAPKASSAPKPSCAAASAPRAAAPKPVAAKLAAAVKPAAAAKAPVKPPTPEPEEDESEEEGEVLTLAERMRKQMAFNAKAFEVSDDEEEEEKKKAVPKAAAPAPKAATSKPAPKAKPAAKPKKKVTSDSEDESEPSEDDFSDGDESEDDFAETKTQKKAPAKAAAAPAKKAAAAPKAAPKKKAPSAMEEDDVTEIKKKGGSLKRAQKGATATALSNLSSPGAPSPDVKKKMKKETKPKAAPKAKAPAPSKKKTIAVESDDESEDEVVVMQPRTPKPARARKVIAYDLDSGSEDEEESDAGSEEEPDSEFDEE